MKERPILFSGPMVRALLAGTKTQTRRAVKFPHQNSLGVWEPTTVGGPGLYLDKACTKPANVPERAAMWHTRTADVVGCPYGAPGDRLWVRENGWERPERTPRMMREGADTWAPYYYDADPWGEQDHADFKAWGFKRRPSIHMPRWASRLTLEVTGIRVERLQAISVADAVAEGVEPIESEREDRDWSICPRCGGTLLYTAFHGETLGAMPDTDCYECDTAVKRYRHLWEHINGAGSWAASPWVWVVEFRRAA